MNKILATGFLFLFTFLSAMANDVSFPWGASLNASSTPAGAALQDLAVVRSDRDTNISNLRLALDSNEMVLGVSFETQTSANPPLITGDYFFPRVDIASTAGVALITSGSHRAVLLQGWIDENSGTGKMMVSYLSNGLSNIYKNCQVNLQRSGRDWKLVNAYTGQVVTDVMVRTWSFGINTLENICPAAQ